MSPQFSLHSFLKFIFANFSDRKTHIAGRNTFIATDIWFMLGRKRKYYCNQESGLASLGLCLYFCVLSFFLNFLKGCIVNLRLLTSEWIKLEIDQSLISIVEYFNSQYKILVVAVRG